MSSRLPRHEQEARHRAVLPVVLAPGDAIGQDLAGRAVQRDEPVAAELRAAHGQHRGVEIDVRSSRPRASPTLMQETARRPNRQWRGHGLKAHRSKECGMSSAAGSSFRISSSEQGRGLARFGWKGSGAGDGNSVRGSAALRWRAKIRTQLNRLARQDG